MISISKSKLNFQFTIAIHCGDSKFKISLLKKVDLIDQKSWKAQSNILLLWDFELMENMQNAVSAIQIIASSVAQLVKNPPSMEKTWVWSLGQEDPLEKEMATHSRILAWEIPWAEEPGGLWSIGSQESDMT